ncbi:MAG TPA: serine/threonine-protein kinase [Kofleriaceae bacterium]|jgi:tRNA A-37 threonylcarbamoyl transferase component Bud32
MSRLGGLLVLLGGTALAAGVYEYARTVEPPVVHTMEPARAAERVTAGIRAFESAVHERAATLAQLLVLRAAIGTDPATVQDLTRDERSFNVGPGEAIELAQRADGRVTTLLRVPEGAPPLPLAADGQTLALAGGTLVAIDVERVAPTDPTLPGGAIGVSRAQALDDVVGAVAIDEHAMLGARLELGGQRIELGGGIAANAPTVSVALPLPGAPQLVVPAQPPPSTLARQLKAVAAGLLALGWIGGLVIARLGRRRAPKPDDTLLDVTGVPGDRKSAQATQLGVPAPPIVVAPRPARPIPSSPTAQTNPFAAPPVPRRLGRYEPLELLGKGGTASVYLARATGEAGFERRVALKVLRPEFARQQKIRSMFLDEARLASRVDHQNVVQIFDLGRAGDDYFIAMEHVDGADLESLLDTLRHARKPMPIELALGVARRICDGLEAAHTARDPSGAPLDLVHRDMKPGNVLLSRSGAVKVADFGIAKATPQRHQTNTGETKGTVQFMAPEQRMGKSVDVRADVFGAGAIAYELATGLALNLDLRKLAELGLEGWPHLPPVGEVRAGAPPELQEILWQALAYRPEDRFASARALEQAICDVMVSRGWHVSDRDIGAFVTATLPQRGAA